MSETYRVVVTHEDHAWLADVPELAGAHTYARNLESLDRYVREVIVLAADLPDDAPVDLAWEYHTGNDERDGILSRLRGKRAYAEQLTQEVAQESARAVRALASNFSLRDSAALVGVSRARAQQLRVAEDGAEFALLKVTPDDVTTVYGGPANDAFVRGIRAVDLGQEEVYVIQGAWSTGQELVDRLVSAHESTEPAQPATPVSQ